MLHGSRAIPKEVLTLWISTKKVAFVEEYRKVASRTFPKGVMIQKLAFLCVISVFINYYSSAFGWNATGHMLVAKIAWEEMGQPARQKAVTIIRGFPQSKVDALLAIKPQFFAGVDQYLFLKAATWPDKRSSQGPLVVYFDSIYSALDFVAWPKKSNTNLGISEFSALYMQDGSIDLPPIRETARGSTLIASGTGIGDRSSAAFV